MLSWASAHQDQAIVIVLVVWAIVCLTMGAVAAWAANKPEPTREQREASRARHAVRREAAVSRWLLETRLATVRAAPVPVVLERGPSGLF